MKCQKGITLIEILATLTILSLVLIIIWNVFFQLLGFADRVQTQTEMQQEANLILTVLRKAHQTTNQYDLFYNSEPQSSYVTIITDSNSFEFNHPKFIYKLYIFSGNGETQLPNKQKSTIIPKDEDLPIKLVIIDKDNPSITYESKAYLSILR